MIKTVNSPIWANFGPTRLLKHAPKGLVAHDERARGLAVGGGGGRALDCDRNETGRGSISRPAHLNNMCPNQGAFRGRFGSQGVWEWPLGHPRLGGLL